jgi:hypothetical protein
MVINNRLYAPAVIGEKFEVVHFWKWLQLILQFLLGYARRQTSDNDLWKKQDTQMLTNLSIEYPRPSKPDG